MSEVNDTSDLQKEYETSLKVIRSETEKLLLISNRIEQKLQQLKEKEQQQKKLEMSLEENIAKAKQKIRLEIGGQIFATSKNTLLSIKDTYFHAMLSGGRWNPDEDGKI